MKPDKPVSGEALKAGGPSTSSPGVALDASIEDAGSRALQEALRSSFVILKVIMVGLILLSAGSGIFSVEPGERAVVLRFGRAVGQGESALLKEGIHWAWPYPIDEVVKVRLSEVQTVRSRTGWYFTRPELEATGQEPPPKPTLHPGQDSYTLTGDSNILHVRADLRYRINDPLRYLFDFTQASNQVQRVLDSALVFASAQYSIDDALRRDRTGFREKVEGRARELAQVQGLGIVIERADLQIIPPRQLATNFNAVVEAETRQSEQLNQARVAANEKVSEARSSAASIVGSALSETNRVLQVLSSEARRFEELLPQYRSNPELFMLRHQTEAVGEALSHVEDFFSLNTPAPGTRRQLRLNLNREVAPVVDPSARSTPTTKKKGDDH